MKWYGLLFLSVLSTSSAVFAQATQPFTPNTTQTQTTGQRTFGGGVSFSGVGGAIASCLAGSKFAQDGIKGLKDSLGINTGSSSGATGLSVAVNDSRGTAEEQKQNEKERCLDAVAYSVAQTSLQQMTNQTLNWVNTGFAGNPLYVRDTQSFLSSIENQQIRNFVQTSVTGGNQGATGGQVTNGLISILTGRKINSSTAPQTQSEQEYQSFMTDFRNGGWSGWLRSIDPSVNPVAQTLKQSQDLQNNITENKLSIIQELEQGSGFLSQKRCAEEGSGTNPDGSKTCLRYETVTPGSVIASQLQTVLGSKTRQLENADELNEIVGAFFDSLLNNLFGQGLQALSTGVGRRTGTTGTQFGGPGSNVLIGSNGQVIPSLTNSPKGIDTGDFNISNPRHLAAIIKTQKDFLNQSLDSQASLQKIPLNLGKLDYCFPGPNPGWESAVETSAPGFQGAILQGKPKFGDGTLVLGKYSLFDPVKNEMREFVRARESGRYDYQIYLELRNIASYSVLPSPLDLIIGTIFGNQEGADMTRVPPRVLFILDFWYDEYRAEMERRYNEIALQNAFIQAREGIESAAFVRTYVKNIYKQISGLYGYAQATTVLDAEYNNITDETTVAIERLEKIRARQLAIVTAARARHIAEKRAQGITVNLSCLNQNYDITNTPIVGKVRQEPDADTEKALLQKYSDEFYANVNP